MDFKQIIIPRKNFLDWIDKVRDLTGLIESYATLNGLDFDTTRILEEIESIEYQDLNQNQEN